MSGGVKRLEKLETGLTPKQAILLWFQEAHGFNTIFEYIHHLKSQPDSAAPIPRLTDQVAGPIKQTLKGQPREDINRAISPNPPKEGVGSASRSGQRVLL